MRGRPLARTRTNSTPTGSGDPIIKYLAIGAFSVFVLILTATLWIISANIMDPPAPRSYHERQLELLETVVTQKPKSARAWADYARAYIAAKQYSQAARVLVRGEKIIGVATPELTLERARLSVARGDRAEGLKLVQNSIKVTTALRQKTIAELGAKGVTVDPRTVKGDEMASAGDLEGDLLAAEKQWPEAVKAYSIAVYEKPANADYLVKRGAVYIEMKEEKKAKADFEKALTYIPGFKPALSGLERIEKGSAQ